MMFWYGNGMGGWGYPLMITSMVLFWALLILGGVALYRHFNRLAGPASDMDPERLLAQRFARGDIEQDEFQRRMNTLRGNESGGAS